MASEKFLLQSLIIFFFFLVLEKYAHEMNLFFPINSEMSIYPDTILDKLLIEKKFALFKQIMNHFELVEKKNLRTVLDFLNLEARDIFKGEYKKINLNQILNEAKFTERISIDREVRLYVDARKHILN